MTRVLAMCPLLLCVTSCSFRTFYPAIGATVAAAGGAVVGGPGGAAMAAGTGALVGQLIKGEEDVIDAKEETKEVIKAISEGDVMKMLEIQAGKQKGTFDKVIDGIYQVLWLLGLAGALWFVLPIMWAKWHVQKTVKKHVEAINGKDTSSS